MRLQLRERATKYFSGTEYWIEDVGATGDGRCVAGPSIGKRPMEQALDRLTREDALARTVEDLMGPDTLYRILAQAEAAT